MFVDNSRCGIDIHAKKLVSTNSLENTFTAMRRRENYMTSMAALAYILPTRGVQEIKYKTATHSHDSLYRLVGTWWTVGSVFSLSGSRYKSIFNHFTEFPPFHSGLVLPLRIPHRLLLHVLLLLVLRVQATFLCKKTKHFSCF